MRKIVTRILFVFIPLLVIVRTPVSAEENSVNDGILACETTTIVSISELSCKPFNDCTGGALDLPDGWIGIPVDCTIVELAVISTGIVVVFFLGFMIVMGLKSVIKNRQRE